MKPSTAAALGLAILLCTAAVPAVIAQGAGGQPGSPSAPPASGGEDIGSNNLFLPGDQTISLSAGIDVPAFILPSDPTAPSGAKLYTGGVFSLSYQYFVGQGLAIGGTVGGAFNSTIGSRSLFIAPLSFRTAYWWSLMQFEFCVGVEGGGYILRLDTDGILGLFAKAGGGVYWRVAPSWSVGVQSYFWLVPELHTGSYTSYDRTSGFVEIAIAAFYHL